MKEEKHTSFPESHITQGTREPERETKLIADIPMKLVWHVLLERINSNLNLHNHNHNHTLLHQRWEIYFKVFAKLQSTQK